MSDARASRARARNPLLVLVSATPFASVALVHCSRPAVEPALAGDAAVAASSSPSPEPKASASLGDGTAGASSVAASASTVDPRATCIAARDAYESFLRAHQGCTSDADCDAFRASCGLTAPCGVGVNRASKKELALRNSAYGGCWGVLGGACPSCPIPTSAPRCATGKCEYP